jgi:hypothetical protein
VGLGAIADNLIDIGRFLAAANTRSTWSEAIDSATAIPHPRYWTLTVTLIEWVSAVEPVPDVPVSVKV